MMPYPEWSESDADIQFHRTRYTLLVEWAGCSVASINIPLWNQLYGALPEVGEVFGLGDYLTQVIGIEWPEERIQIRRIGLI